MSKTYVVIRVGIGLFALIVWLLLFTTGLLIDSKPFRLALAPTPATTLAKADNSQSTRTEPNVADVEPSKLNGTRAFLAAMVCFTPTNLLFLTLFAGLLGGCSSNLVAARAEDSPTISIEPHRMSYLSENPWSAMMRSFVVYLCVIAGLYFAMDDPFKAPTAAQYMRLAGTLSILAFVVGYDPSRIIPLLDAVPRPRPTQTLTLRGNKEGIEVTAAQGQLIGAAAHDGVPTDDAPDASSKISGIGGVNRGKPK
jgi:hypothetical protein